MLTDRNTYGMRHEDELNLETRPIKLENKTVCI